MPKAYCLFTALFLLILPLAAESFIIDEIITLTLGQYAYPLKHQKIIHHSEIVQADSLQLQSATDYRIDYKSGILHLNSLDYAGLLYISYLILPPHLASAQYSYKYIDYTDSTQVILPPKSLFTDRHNLEISGSKTFALSFSESGDTELLQSLYVNLSGELTPDITITAQLSDSQSRLSPEGDSKELSSLDQVFVKLAGKKWQIGMGDLDLSFTDSRYLTYNTKVEGALASYQDYHQLLAAYNAGGGKSAKISLEIIDGKQGPYYLSPNEYQRSYIIVAASEEVYQNGKALERGRDYYIDYAEGSLMFKSLVYSTDQITVYFQYAEENYSQSSYFLSGKWQLAPSLKLSHHLIHQVDSKSNALLFDLTDADIESLKAAGDRPVYSPGASETEAGSGRYILKTDASGYDYYEYAYGDSTANYDVIFSYVGYGMGDYEEYSQGKYRWVGSGEGAYLPVKRLIPPTNRSNFELGLSWEHSHWLAAVDAMYSHNDLNSFSKLDNEDNHGAIFSFRTDNSPSDSAHRLDLSAEHRLRNSYRFSSLGSPDADFAMLSAADSLSQSTVDLAYGFQNEYWQPSLSFRYRDLEDHYRQKALRYSQNSQILWGFIPGTRLQGSVSLQEGNQASTLQYYDLELFWQYRLLRLRLNALLNQLDYSDGIDSRYQKLSPTLELKGNKHFSSLALIQDESAYRADENWQKTLNSQSLQLMHNSSFKNHNLELNYSHRQVEKPDSDEAKNAYDLLNLNSSHQILKGAMNLYNNFQLNQTEFFPSIRDLVYVGSGQGFYDSTGVHVDVGDYIYEYISSPKGKLSTELSLYSSLYLKPGLYLKEKLWQRLQADFSFSFSQNKEKADESTNLDTSLSSTGQIYKRLSQIQNFWLDLYQNRILAKINFEQSREDDFRYQSPEKSSWNITKLKLESRGFFEVNEALELLHESETESRYDSKLNRYTVKSETEKNISSAISFGMELYYAREEGQKQSGAENSYTLNSVGFSPSIKSVLTQKYRLSARVALAHNHRQGTDFLNFLPQKRAGFLSEGQLLGIYRLSQISSITLEYRMNSYPKSKSSHNLKLEFKAEL